MCRPIKNVGGLGGTPQGVGGRLAAMAAAGEIDQAVADGSVVVAAAKLETFSGHCTGGGPARRLIRGGKWTAAAAVNGTFADEADTSGLVLSIIKSEEGSPASIVLFKPNSPVVDKRMTIPEGAGGLIKGAAFGRSHVITEESASITSLGDRTFEITFIRKLVKNEMGFKTLVPGLQEGKVFQMTVESGDDGDKLVAWLSEHGKTSFEADYRQEAD